MAKPRRKHSCRYLCNVCQLEGTGPQMEHDPHWGDLEPLDHKTLILICQDCPEDERECGMSDHVCDATRSLMCPHCAGVNVKFRKREV